MKSCVCYVIDDNYLFPTLVSAIQARKNVPAARADVIIICICENRDKGHIAEAVAAKFGVEILYVKPEQIGNMHPMFGRLFIGSLLPPEYERIAYIDGDTQINGSLVPLFDADIAPLTFLAVRDPSNMFARLSDKWMRRVRHDRDAAGLTRSYDDYFNTGVLVFNRSDWGELSRQTLEAVEAQAEAGGFKFGDQDPMNLAIGDRCVFISNKWNFAGFFIGSPLEQSVKPVIYHFMSNPRPWTHRGMPWGPKWQRPYQDLLREYPDLASLAPQTSPKDKIKYHLQQLVKVALEYSPVGKKEETRSDVFI